MRNCGTTTTTPGLPSKYCFCRNVYTQKFTEETPTSSRQSKWYFLLHCFQLPIRMKHLGKTQAAEFVTGTPTESSIGHALIREETSSLDLSCPSACGDINSILWRKERNIKFMLFNRVARESESFPDKSTQYPARPSLMEEDRWKQTSNTNI